MHTVYLQNLANTHPQVDWWFNVIQNVGLVGQNIHQKGLKASSWINLVLINQEKQTHTTVSSLLFTPWFIRSYLTYYIVIWHYDAIWCTLPCVHLASFGSKASLFRSWMVLVSGHRRLKPSHPNLSSACWQAAGKHSDSPVSNLSWTLA